MAGKRRYPGSGIMGRTGPRRLNVAALRKAMGVEAGGARIEMGQIALFDGEADIWDTTDEGDIIVSVEMDAGHVPLWAVWSPLGGGPNLGIYYLPAVGTEVVIAFPYGDYEGTPIALGALPGEAPGDLQPGRVLVMGPEVWVYDGTGTPEKLATLADVQNVRDALDGHSHTYTPGGNPPTQTTGNPSVPAPTGTDVLRGK